MIDVKNSSIVLQVLPVPIMQQNGLIISHTFIYSPHNSSDSFSFTRKMNETTLRVENVTTVAPLAVFTVYNISVYASTVIGDGPVISLQQRTSEGSK